MYSKSLIYQQNLKENHELLYYDDDINLFNLPLKEERRENIIISTHQEKRTKDVHKNVSQGFGGIDFCYFLNIIVTLCDLQ